MAFGRRGFGEMGPAGSAFFAAGGASSPGVHYIGAYSPLGTPIFFSLTTGAAIGVGTRPVSRFQRIVHRITRYVILAGAMTGLGFLAGYYLTMATAAAVSASISLAGGIRVTRMLSRDIAMLGVESSFIKWSLAAKGGALFALLPWLGAGTGLLLWSEHQYLHPLKKYVRDRITRAGRRGLTGW
jgi:type IV secretory pathway TrbD component